MIPSQMLKGVLEGCVLAIIAQNETYGYEISQQLEHYGFGKITEGTIYPLLLRLEKNGRLEAVYRASDVGPKRKYYHLTDAGREELSQFVSDFGEMAAAVQTLLNDEGGTQDERIWQEQTELQRDLCAGKIARQRKQEAF